MPWMVQISSQPSKPNNNVSEWVGASVLRKLKGVLVEFPITNTISFELTAALVVPHLSSSYVLRRCSMGTMEMNELDTI